MHALCMQQQIFKRNCQHKHADTRYYPIHQKAINICLTGMSLNTNSLQELTWRGSPSSLCWALVLTCVISPFLLTLSLCCTAIITAAELLCKCSKNCFCTEHTTAHHGPYPLSQVGNDCQDGVQHCCSEAHGTLWRPALHILPGIVCVLEGHLQGECQAVVSLAHSAGANCKVGLARGIHAIPIPASPVQALISIAVGNS